MTSAGCGGSVEHALDDGWGLVAIGAVTELLPHVDGADGRDCLDAMVGGGGGDHVATGGADAQCANAIRCNLVAQRKETAALISSTLWEGSSSPRGSPSLSP